MVASWRASGPAEIREAIARTVTIHQLADQPEWTPHLSVAYSNADGPAEPVIAALEERPQPRALTVDRVHLVSQERTDRLSLPMGLPRNCRTRPVARLRQLRVDVRTAMLRISSFGVAIEQ